MIDDRIWKLLARKLSEEADLNDLKELEKLIKDNPDLHHFIDTFSSLWTASVKETSDPDVEKLLNRIRPDPDPPLYCLKRI